MITLLDCEIAELALFRAALDQQAFNDWFDKSEIKARVKKACMHIQQLRCCYCREVKTSANSAEWDLEHILCERDYPQFFATPLNLAIVCKRCNNAKRHQDVYLPQPRPDPAMQIIPPDSASYAIPHPWLDSWDDYLTHINFQIYSSEEPKGIALIKVCKLNKTAVDEAGLDYESVVQAVRSRFFDHFGGEIDPEMPDEALLAKVAGMRENLEALQAEGHLAKLARDLVKLEAKARKRNPDLMLASYRERRQMAELIEQIAAVSDGSDPDPAAAHERPALPRLGGRAIVHISGGTPPRRPRT